jgi:hypothetical protein
MCGLALTEVKLKGKQTVEFKKGGANIQSCKRRGKPIFRIATKGNHAIPPSIKD